MGSSTNDTEINHFCASSFFRDCFYVMSKEDEIIWKNDKR
jgi:hypothetical protein